MWLFSYFIRTTLILLGFLDLNFLTNIAHVINATSILSMAVCSLGDIQSNIWLYDMLLWSFHLLMSWACEVDMEGDVESVDLAGIIISDGITLVPMIVSYIPLSLVVANISLFHSIQLSWLSWPRNINSDLQTLVHLTTLRDSILSPPLVQPCTNTFPIFRSDPTPQYVFPFVFPLWALLHITLLVIPCLPLGDARLFLFIHIQYSRTFLIRPQYLPDLDSPLFSFCTDFELYKQYNSCILP